MYWTIESALRAWRQPRPTLFLVYAEGATAAVAEYFALSFPEHDVIFEPDDVGSDVAYFRAAEPPLRLEQVLANLECRGARVDYEILAGDESTVLDGTTSFVPFVDPTTWAVDWTSRAPRGRIRVRVRSRIATPEDGAAWTIAVKGRVPEALWTIDGFLAEGVGPDARVPSATLTPGVHDVEVVASFPAGSVNPTFRIVWRPEDGAEDSLELVPFYSQSVEKPGCVSGSRPVVQAGH
jgi:hypothetical protein